MVLLADELGPGGWAAVISAAATAVGGLVALIMLQLRKSTNTTFRQQARLIDRLQADCDKTRASCQECQREVAELRGHAVFLLRLCRQMHATLARNNIPVEPLPDLDLPEPHDAAGVAAEFERRAKEHRATILGQRAKEAGGGAAGGE